MNLIIRQNIISSFFEIFLFSMALLCLSIAMYIYFISRHNKEHSSKLVIDHYRKLLENTQEVICLVILKPKIHFEYISPSISTLTGYFSEDFYNSPELLKSIIHPDDYTHLAATVKMATASRSGQICSLRLVKPDKSVAKLEIKLIPGFEDNKTLSGFYVMAHKSPALAELPQNSAYWERLNMISQLASSVAHEIRNPMTTVKGYLQFFSEKIEFVKYREQFDLIIDELDRTNLIIKEYLSLNQNKATSLKLCQLNNIVHSLYPLLKVEANSAGKDIKIYTENIPELLLDENEIRQLILNMVKNGLDSMGNMKDRVFINISTYLEDGKAVLSIKDQGLGISPDILADMGKAFFTTKEQGTGLGLMVCYKIADNHKAQIKFNTNHNGTVFFVQFSLPELFEKSKSA